MLGGITWLDFAIADLTHALVNLNIELIKPYQGLIDHQKRIWNLP